jgi:Asp-tRNA(Asn)/Glu-tRNA(Gln) amidotransferase A subunit family amidase
LALAGFKAGGQAGVLAICEIATALVRHSAKWWAVATLRVEACNKLPHHNDRVPDTSDPNGSRLDGPKLDQLPAAMEFLARPFDEARLFEIASAYQSGTKHRGPPKAFGPLAGEP